MNNKEIIMHKRMYFILIFLLCIFSLHIHATDTSGNGTPTPDLKNTDLNPTISDGQMVLNAGGLNIVQQALIRIQGTVTDEDGEPIIGASIIEKGTKNGVITNIDGHFSIEVPQDATIRINFMGYLEQEIKVGTSTSYRVVLKEDTQILDEVVVIGYGSASTRKIGNAVTKISTENIKNIPASNMAAALSGLGQGLIIKQTSGGPGWDIPNVSIRGGGEPLYVIDGIISTKNDFARLSASDVEDITILKDAGASAVYGSRAANGVILVTTKNPNGNKISYSNNFSWSTPTVNPKRLNSYEYVNFTNRIADATGVTRPYSDEDVAKYLSGDEPDYTSTIYWDEVFKKYAPTQRHNLTLQGKEETIDYILSLNYQTAKSMYKVSNAHYQDVYSVMGKIGKQYTELGLKVDAKLGATIRDYKETPFDYFYIFMHTDTKLPILNPYNSEGNYKQIDGMYNPLYMVDPANGYNRMKDNVFTGTASVVWDLPWVKGLQVGLIGNYGISFWHNKAFTSYQPFYDEDNNPIYQQKPSLSESKSNSNNWTMQTYVNYKKEIGKHNLDVALYYEAYDYKYWTMSASRKDYTSDMIDQLFFGSQNGLTNTGSASESARLAYIGRLSYDYDDKYLISGSFRYDASERFRKEDRWGFFPSVSLSWRLSKEAFMVSLMEKLLINNLKIRFSYGEVGDDSISRFAYLSTYGVSDKRYYMNGEWLSGIYSNGLPAGNISWYKQVNYNGGIELEMLDSRLKLVADAFYYRTSGYLASPKVDYTVPLGFSLPQINFGSQRRGGYEFSLNWKDKLANGFEYTVGGNFTHFDSLWEENPNESLTTTMNPYLRTNHQSSAYNTHGYITKGYYTSMEDVLNYPRLNGQVEMLPGDLKYYDANGDGKIDSDDFRKIGKGTQPRYYYGFNTGASYKGFYVTALFQGAIGFDMPLNRYERGASSVTLAKMTDVWTPENPNARFPRLNLNTGRRINYDQAQGSWADFWIVRADYFRLKNLEIGYDLKNTLLKKVDFIKGLNVFFSGTNLFTIAPDLMGLIDPESGGISTIQVYPVSKTFSFGVNLDF